MQITRVTMVISRHTLSVALVVSALSGMAGCEQAATMTVNAGVGPPAQSAASFQARVVGVRDGDTITVVDAQNQQHKVRLADVDAPENGQPWGDRSRQALSGLVFSKTVLVQQTDTDRYGRTVARIFSDGLEVNRAMVEQGAAWAYRRYLTDQTLIATEARARRERVGLWSLGDAQTVAPWDWRRGERVGDGAHADTGAETRSPVQSLLAPRSSVGSGSASGAASGSDGGGQFSCSGKRYCSQMSSCAEANFYLRRCGVGSLDGNSDGQPCEVLCGTATFR